jgi:hypothetical protein
MQKEVAIEAEVDLARHSGIARHRGTDGDRRRRRISADWRFQDRWSLRAGGLRKRACPALCNGIRYARLSASSLGQSRQKRLAGWRWQRRFFDGKLFELDALSRWPCIGS